MEKDPRYIAFKEYAGRINSGNSVDPHSLSSVISEAEDVVEEERNRDSQDRIELNELLNVGLAMITMNHYYRGEKDKSKSFMDLDEAKDRLKIYVSDDSGIFQIYDA